MASSSKALTIIEEECKHCTPCKTKDKKIDSQYYCTDCEAYYCEECFDPHPRVPYLAKHIVLKHDDIDVWSKVQYKCTIHDKNLEFFCREHKMLCCHVCVSLKHRSCVDMEYIMESSKNICSNGEVGEMLQRTKKELEEIDLFENKFEMKTMKNEQSKSEYIRELKEKIRNLKEILDIMETKAIDIMTERFEANKQYSDDMCRNLKAFKAQLGDLKNQLTTATAEKECLIFICLKRGVNTLDHIKKEMSDMDVKSYKENFKPKFDDRIESYLRDVTHIATLEDEQTRLEDVSSEDWDDSNFALTETDRCDNISCNLIVSNSNNKSQASITHEITPELVDFDVEIERDTSYNYASGKQRVLEYKSPKTQASKSTGKVQVNNYCSVKTVQDTCDDYDSGKQRGWGYITSETQASKSKGKVQVNDDCSVKTDQDTSYNYASGKQRVSGYTKKRQKGKVQRKCIKNRNEVPIENTI